MIEPKRIVRVPSRRPARCGTSLVISVPVTLSSLLALVVEVKGTTAALPLEAVDRALSVTPAEVIRSGQRELLAFGEGTIPLVDLARVLGAPGTDRAQRRAESVIVVRGGGDRRAAFVVDRLLGTSTEVALSLPAHAEVAAFPAGASTR